MDIDLAALPSDIDTLHQLVRDLATQIADDQSELAQAQAEIERLKLIIRRFQRAQFGRRSERIDGAVQPKAVMFPTDAKLLNRARERLVRLTKKLEVSLRQSYARSASWL